MRIARNSLHLFQFCYSKRLISTEYSELNSISSKYKYILKDVASPVVIVTCKTNDHVVGMTASSFTSISLNPPIVSFSLRASSRMQSAVRECINYNVSILSYAQSELAVQFSHVPRNDALILKYHSVDELGIPYLKDSSVLFCRNKGSFEVGDHILYLAEVVNLYYHDKIRPLIYHQSQYTTVKE